MMKMNLRGIERGGPDVTWEWNVINPYLNRGRLRSEISPKFKEVFMDARLRLGMNELISA
jgi:hypothetical protein